MNNDLLKRYSEKSIDPNLYGKLIVSGSSEPETELTQTEFENGKSGIIYLNIYKNTSEK